MENNQLRYFITTYTGFSHNHVIALLSSQGAEYRFEQAPTEETYSRFEIISSRDVFEVLREASKENNGSSFSLEYGTY